MLDKEYILTQDIENQVVTVIGSSTGYKNGKWTCSNLRLKHILWELTDYLKDELNEVQLMEYHSEEQKKAKNNLPRFYIAGKYSTEVGFHINDREILEYSNLMTVDIDEKDNTDVDIWKIREELFKEDYIYSLIKSCSGHGYYAIIPIEDGKYTKLYYSYISKLWKQKYNLITDKQANSFTRARILSWDDERDKWIKKDKVCIWKLKDEEEKKVKVENKVYSNESLNYKENLTHLAMAMLINDGYSVEGYNKWFYTGCELANFQDGESLFIEMSKNGKYHDSIDDILKKWAECIKHVTGLTDDIHRKWQGMAKNRFGKDWMKTYLD